MKKIIVMMIGLVGFSFSTMHSMDRRYINELQEEFDVVMGVDAFNGEKGNIHWARTPISYEEIDQRLAKCATFAGTKKIMREDLLYQQMYHLLNNINNAETKDELRLKSYEHARRDSVVQKLDADVANIKGYQLLIGARMEPGCMKNTFDGKLIISSKIGADLHPLFDQGDAIAERLKTEFGIHPVEVIVLKKM